MALDLSTVERFVAHIQHLPIKTLHFDEKTRTVSFQHPGLGYNSYDGHGLPSVQSMMWLNTSAFMYYLTTPYNSKGDMWLFNFFDFARTAGTTIMATTLQMAVSRDMYDITVCKRDLVVDLSAHKGTSKFFTIVLEVYSSNRQHLLYKAIQNIACIELESKCMVDLPLALTEILPSSSLCDLVVFKKDLGVAKMCRPKDAFTDDFEVSWRQIDFNRHMSWAEYVVSALNTLALALKTSSSSLTDDMGSLNMAAGVSDLEVRFIDECNLGDKLSVYVWKEDTPTIENSEDDENFLDVCDVVEPAALIKSSLEKDGKPICQMAFTFHSSSQPVNVQEAGLDSPMMRMSLGNGQG